MRIKNKKTYKLSRGKCVLCGESNLATLDIHRIHEGANKGTYDHENCVLLCSNCHRKVHAGQIKIIRRHKTLSWREYIEVIENGERKMIECT
jgi:5-methylcytosine-specific restriction endonuclease McrA